MQKEKLYGKTLDELIAVAKRIGMPGFAARQIADWLYRNSRISILANEGLKLYAKPDDGKDGFLERCLKEADRLMVPELDKLEDAFRKKKDALEDKIRKQEGEVQLREQNVSQRTMEAIGTAGTAIFGMLLAVIFKNRG